MSFVEKVPEILKYEDKSIKNLMANVRDNYLSNLTGKLPFEEFKNIMLERGSETKNVDKNIGIDLVDYSKPIRIAPDVKLMLKLIEENRREIRQLKESSDLNKKEQLNNLYKRLFEPYVKIIDFKGNPPTLDKYEVQKFVDDNGREYEKEVLVGKVPMWINSSRNGLNIRPGYVNGDKRKPYPVTLNDDGVHMMLGGITGSGKSVMLNDLIVSMMIEYAPWEVAMYLTDFKKVELSRYGNTHKSPHVKVVAATEDSDYVTSMFNHIKEEMMDRQKLFEAVELQHVKDFRKEFNMVLPRVLILSDEFTQLYENIKDSEMNGNESADEERQQINASISALSRLGRNAGFHQLLSSQTLDGTAGDDVFAQFKVGVSLKATPDVSKSLIGNNGGAYIAGHGRCVVNKDKTKGAQEENISYRVPFIDGDMKPMPDGTQSSYLDDLLGKLVRTASSLPIKMGEKTLTGFDYDLAYYSSDERPLIEELNKDIEDVKEIFYNPPITNETDLELYKKNALLNIALGRTTVYREDTQVEYVTIKLEKNCNMVVHSKRDGEMEYILEILARNSKIYGIDNYICSGNEALLRKSNLMENLGVDSLSGVNDIGDSLKKKIKDREEMIELQNMFNESNGGYWDNLTALKEIVRFNNLKTSPNIINKYVGILEREGTANFADYVEDADYTSYSKDADIDGIIDGCIKFFGYKRRYALMAGYSEEGLADVQSNRGMTELDLTGYKIELDKIKPMFVWLVGFDNFEGLTSEDYDNTEKLKKMFTDGYKYGIVYIFAFTYTNLVGKFANTANHIFENADKSSLMDLDLPGKTNPDDIKFVYQNRKDKSLRRLVKKYEIL